MFDPEPVEGKFWNEEKFFMHERKLAEENNLLRKHVR